MPKDFRLYLLGLNLITRSPGNFKRTEEASLFLAVRYIVDLNKVFALFIGTLRKWIWGRSPAGPLWETRPNLPRLSKLMALGYSS